MQPITFEPRRPNVAIVGFAKPHRMEAPFHDPAWEIWSVNDAWGFLPPNSAHRMFEVHKPWIYEWELRRSPGHLDWLRAFGEAGGRVYMLDEHPDLVPKAEAYPLQAVAANIGKFGYYLTSSIAYMIALAIAEGFERIMITGVDMAAESEYSDQRPACEYLIGVAQGRGIEVILPESCKLMKGPLYGRGWINPGGERITTNQLQARIKALKQGEAQTVAICDNNLALIQQIKGAMASNRDLIGVHPEMAPLYKSRIDDLEGQLAQATQGWSQQMEHLNQIRGAISETMRWIGITPEGGDPRNLPAVETADVPAPQQGVEQGDYLIPRDLREEAARHGHVWPPEQNQDSPNGEASEALAVVP